MSGAQCKEPNIIKASDKKEAIKKYFDSDKEYLVDETYDVDESLIGSDPIYCEGVK